MRRETTEPSVDASRPDVLVARRDEALMTPQVTAPPQRRWPSWLCILCLGGVVAWQQWQLQGLQDLRGQQNDQLSRQVSVLEDNVDNDAHLLGDVDSRLSELAAQVNDTLQGQIKDLQQADSAQSDALARQATDLQDELEELTGKASSRDDSHDEQLKTLVSRIEALAPRVAAQTQAGDNRDTLLTALQGSVSALESLGRDGRATLKARLDGQAETLASLTSTLEQQADQLDKLSAQWQKEKDEAAANPSQPAVSAAELAAVKQSQAQAITALKQQLEQQQRSLASLGEQVTTALKQSSQASEGVDQAELKREVAHQIDASLAPLSKTQSSLSAQIGELRRQQTALDAGLEAQSQNSRGDSDASERLRSLDASRRQLTGRVASMLSQVSQLEQRVTRLER